MAGPLGFEPRQSAPKALDLPLVDGPVFLARDIRKLEIPRKQRSGFRLRALPFATLRVTPAKRLNLPLVDGPVRQLIAEFRLLIEPPKGAL